MRVVEADVLVVGGGTAGAVAAIAAARQGARTIVVEQTGALGGTQTMGWVTPMMPNYLGDFKLNRGINLEVIESQSVRQPQVLDGTPHGDVWYDPFGLAAVLDDLADQAGVTCLFNATLVDVQKKDRGAIASVEVATREGRIQLRAKAFIDATGDGELGRLAGAELMSGNETGQHQPMTLRFTMGGVNIPELRAGFPHFGFNNEGHVELGFTEAKDAPLLGDWVRSAIEAGVLEGDDLGYFQFFTMNGRPGELAFNAPRIAGLNPLDAFELSRAYQVGRAKIQRIVRFMQGWFPGCAAAFLNGVAPLMGIRESRRIVGELILTASDHQTCRKFPNPIARNRYPVDIHLQHGVDFRHLPPGDWHDIPYEVIVAKGLENLLVAGRCVSADFVAQSSIRIQPVCRAMGEAAGVAAAYVARAGCAARDVPYDVLAGELDLSIP